MIKHPQNSILILLTAFLFLSFDAKGQDGYSVVTRDLETWSTIGLKYKPNKKINFGLDQGLRLDSNSFRVNQILTDLSIKWKLAKYLDLGVGFRYILDKGGNGLFDNDFRINFDATFKHEIKPFSFKYRLRYQSRNEIGLSTADGDYFKNYLRLKAEMAYNIKKWKFDPVISSEIYRDLTKYTGSFDKLRFTLGTNYNTKKVGSFGLFYRLERDLGVSYPKSANIIGFKYTYTIQKKKKDEN